MKILIAPLALLALLTTTAAPALAAPALAAPALADKPIVKLSINSDGEKTSLAGSLAVPETDVFGLFTLQNSLIRVLETGKVIAIATTISLSENTQIGIKVLFGNGTTQIALTSNPEPLGPKKDAKLNK